MKHLAFMGSDEIALPILKFLKDQSGKGFTFKGLISQPDRQSGRGQKMQPNPISAWALENSLTLFRPIKPSNVELDWLKSESIDLVLVMAYGHILNEEFLKMPRLGMVNFHASILPKYRGASPIESAIAAGETETGISLMQVVKRMDAGGVLDIQKIKIDSKDTSESLRKKLSIACVPLLERNLNTLLSGKSVYKEQDESHASYARKIIKEDGWLDFNQPALLLERRLRALTPWPGGFFVINDIMVKVGSMEVLEQNTQKLPGTVLGSENSSLLIATKENVLKLLSLQRPGGKMLLAREFLRGFTIANGVVLKSNPNFRPLSGLTPVF